MSGNKKVLLRQRKRHTARRVASTRFSDLSPDVGGGGYPPVLILIRYPPVSRMGYPSTCLDLGWAPPGWTWDGVPPPCLNLGWGSPRQQDGVPPSRPGMGVPHHVDLGWGYLPCPDLGRGTAPPLASVNRLKILPSLILRMRVVIIYRVHVYLFEHKSSTW